MTLRDISKTLQDVFTGGKQIADNVYNTINSNSIGHAVIQDVQRSPQFQQLQAVAQLHSIVNPIRNYFNPVSNNGYNFWSSPVNRQLVNIQNFVPQQIMPQVRNFAQGFTTDPTTAANDPRFSLSHPNLPYTFGNFLGNDLLGVGGGATAINEAGKGFSLAKAAIGGSIGGGINIASNALAGRPFDPQGALTNVALGAYLGGITGTNRVDEALGKKIDNVYQIADQNGGRQAGKLGLGAKVKTAAQIKAEISGNIAQPEPLPWETSLKGYTQPGSITNTRADQIAREFLSKTPKERAGMINEVGGKQIFAPQEKTFTKTPRSKYPPQENEALFKTLFDRWIGQRDVAKTTGTEVAAKFKDLPTKQGMDVINFIEHPDMKVSPSIRGAAQGFKAAFDQLYNEANQNGVDVNYLKDYITHIYKESPQRVEKAFRGAGQNFKFASNRTIPTYEEARAVGLHPLYNNPQEILQSYVTKLWQTKANIDFISELRKRNLIVEGRSPGLSPIVAPGIKDGYFAPPKIAQTINRLFSPEENGMVGATMNIGRQISGKVQDITLSGGIPGTPANAFTFAQMQKEFLAGRIKSPVLSFIRSLNSGKSNKFFEDNVGQIKKMQERNVPVHSTFNVGNMIDKTTVEKIFGKSMGEAWNKIVNEPTFAKFMPQLQINLFNDIEKQALKKGKTNSEAADIAAKAVSNFYGISNSGSEAMRAKLTKDTVGTVFFAPKYRESMVNFWINNLKSLKNPLALENRTNFKFGIGAILTFLAMDQINRAQNNGKGMMDNPNGKQDKLLIPLGDGYTLGIPYLSSIATVPRNLVGLGTNLFKGDFPEALNSAKSFLSMAVRPPLDVLTNENYFGQKIYEPGSKTQLQDIGTYLAGAYNHPYVKAGIQLAQGKTPGYQVGSQALELPFRFYKTKNLASSDYFDSLDNVANKLNVNDKQIFLGLIHPQTKDNQGNSIIDKNIYTSPAKYEVLLSNPKIMAAEAVFQHSQPHHDPLWDLNPTQLKAYMMAQVISKNNPGGDKKTVSALYSQVPQDFFDKRTRYFNQLEAQGVNLSSGAAPQTPQTPPEIQAFWDKYFTLPSGTGARSQMLRTPLGQQALALSKQKTDIINKQRVAMGLPELPSNEYTPYARKPRKISIKTTKIGGTKALAIKAPSRPKFKLKKTPTFKISKAKKVKIVAFKNKGVKTHFATRPSGRIFG